MSTLRTATTWVALSLATGLAFGQGQPNAPVSRHVGLDVLGVVSSTPYVTTASAGIVLTVHAPAGSTYDLILESTIASADFSLSSPALVGPLTSPPGVGLPGGPNTTYFYQPGATGVAPGYPALPAASVLPIGTYFTDPTGGVPGVIPAGATSQTLVSGFQLAQGTPANFQALVTDPVGTPANPGPVGYATNGQQRPVIAIPTGLQTSGYVSTSGAFTTGNVRDIEQGDIDGDGDLDEVLVGIPFNGWTYSTISFPGTVPTRTNTSFTMGMNVQAASAELVDLNDDGYMDLVIGGNATFPGGATQRSLFQAYLGAPGVGLVGGTSVTVVFDPALAGFQMDITDVETGDFNGDGLMDVYAACGGFDCDFPELNRLFLGSLSGPGGTYRLVEATGPNMEPVFDDSEDCEVFDFEGDGDLDIVVANYDGGAAATFGNSVNVIHVNNGMGVFTPMPAPGPAVETADVLAVDIDRNGFDDLYFGNFLRTTADCGFTVPIPDDLFLNTAGVFVNMTGLIPNNAWATVDVEAVSIPVTEFSTKFSTRDFDGDGDVDIFIALGSFGNAAAAVNQNLAGVDRGVLILNNQQADLGFPAGGTLPPFVLDFQAAGTEDITDIEMGDWLSPLAPVGRWFEKDFGMARWTGGTSVYSKNP